MRSFYWINGAYYEVEVIDKTDWDKVKSHGVITACDMKPGDHFKKYTVTHSEGGIPKQNREIHFRLTKNGLEQIDPHDTNL